MSLLFETKPFTLESKKNAVQNLMEASTPDRDFYILLTGAIALAVLAIFLDSISVLIASMIVAPLAYPILALGLAVTSFNWRLMYRSIGMLLISLMVAVIFAFFATLAFGYLRVEPVFISFTSDIVLATIIALVAGAIAAYGLMRSKVGGAMTGIGIAVSLMPPLVATGIGIAEQNIHLAQQAFILFLLNVVGILIGSMCVFVIFGINKQLH